MFDTLQARKATLEDLEAAPARIALADAMKHILWVAENYDALDREFPEHPWNAVMASFSAMLLLFEHPCEANLSMQ